jgi:hypothetical protein
MVRPHIRRKESGISWACSSNRHRHAVTPTWQQPNPRIASMSGQCSRPRAIWARSSFPPAAIQARMPAPKSGFRTGLALERARFMSYLNLRVTSAFEIEGQHPGAALTGRVPGPAVVRRCRREGGLARSRRLECAPGCRSTTLPLGRPFPDPAAAVGEDRQQVDQVPTVLMAAVLGPADQIF